MMNRNRASGLPTTNSLMASVADTTAHRDRDSLNGAIAHLLLDFLEAESVTAYRLIHQQPIVLLLPLVVAVRGQDEMKWLTEVESSTLQVLDDAEYWRHCVRHRQAVQYEDTCGPGPESCAVFPIEAAREVIGLLVVKSGKTLEEREIHLVGSILRILKNHVDLLEYGERDTLTHMLNRKTFESRFAKIRENLRALQMRPNANEGSWIGLVDVDKFKSINDSYGHLFGDEVLLLISQIMRECFRGADQLFRFGGEEFVIVLDRAAAAGALIAFDRLRASVEAFTFPQVGQVTISVGYSQIRPDDGPTTCVERADTALYYAKHHGRNRTCHFESLVESGELTAKDESADAELF